MSPATQGSALERIERAHATARPRLRGGGAWDRRRGDALARLLARGLPDRRDENWKYLDWAEIDRRGFSLPAPATGGDMLPEGTLADFAKGMIVVLINGRYVAGLSSVPAQAAVSVQSLASVLETDPGAAARALRVPGDGADERFALLAEAFIDDGAVIRVAAGAQVEEPLYVLHVGTGSDVAHARMLIDAGRNSRLKLVEHFLTEPAADGLSNLACEIHLADGASLDHVRLYQQGAATVHIETLFATQSRDSHYRQQLFVLGGRVVRSNVHIRLEGPAAECEVHGLFMVDGSRQADLYTVIEHVAPNTRSNELVRGVATGRGRGAFNGRIIVGENASKTDSQQSSRNLILSPQAEINTRPQLEILTDDVKCSHGATTGSLDSNQMFYLLSRGIDPETARGLLTFAFCEDVVSRVAVCGLRRHVEQLVVGHLPDRDIIKEFV
jgi:Fe-S cluster assembly protein SufD